MLRLKQRVFWPKHSRRFRPIGYLRRGGPNPDRASNRFLWNEMLEPMNRNHHLFRRLGRSEK